jgi:hypothetical protein
VVVIMARKKLNFNLLDILSDVEDDVDDPDFLPSENDSR